MSTAPIPSPHERSLELASTNGSIALVDPIAPVDHTESVVVDFEKARVESVARTMAELVKKFTRTVEDNPIVDVPPSERELKIDFTELNPSQFTSVSGWSPGRVYSYKSNHPFAAYNPAVSEAAEELIHGTIEVTRSIGEQNNPRLTYIDMNRSKGGKRNTVITQALIDAEEEGLGDWIKNLPQATRIRPVAHPYKDGYTLVLDDAGNPVTKPNTDLMCALLGGSQDGRSVSERESWGRAVLSRNLDPLAISDGTLKITSLGAGTGEPALETGLAILDSVDSEEKKLVVRGFDLDDEALKVAEVIAKTKVTDGVEIDFLGSSANLLDKTQLKDAIEGTRADVYEAIGLAEYIASDHPASPQEAQQRAKMSRLGMLSAEDFYKTVYESMPEGSILLTGNMRDDSPQAEFVINGLGWKGIIQRSTQEYLSIFERAGIPSEAVDFYVPDEENSGRVFNLVAIKKV